MLQSILREYPTTERTCNRVKFGFVRQCLLGFVLVSSACLPPSHAQETRKSLVLLFHLEGTFSSELPIKIRSEDKSEAAPFVLRNARLEADPMGATTRLRSVLTIANIDASRRITEIEWRLDVYDESLHTLSVRVLQEDKLNIYSNETASASARFGAVLPDRMVILLQLVRVSYADGSAWAPPVPCELEEDLRTVLCKSK